VDKPVKPSIPHQRGLQTNAGTWMKDPIYPDMLGVSSMLVGPDTDVVHIGGDTVEACYGFVLIWLVTSKSVSKETRFVFHKGSDRIYPPIKVVCDKVRENKIWKTLVIHYTAFNFPDDVIEIAKTQEQLKHVDFRPRTSIVLTDSSDDSSADSSADSSDEEILFQLEGRAEPDARTIRHFPHLFEQEEQSPKPIQKVRQAGRKGVGKARKGSSSNRK